MYRLLVVDDEPYIVDWVYELFLQQPELELDIYKANSGIEALDLLKKAKIDIVLTDIRMQDMDGIQLQKEIKSRWPLCKVIFLTAYNDFEYAHLATKDGINFVLKTEGDTEIIKSVEKAINEIDNYIKQEELVRNAKYQMEKALPLMQREYLIEKLEGRYSEQITQEQLNDLGINLSADEDIIIVIGRSDDWFLPKQATDKVQQFAIIQAITQSIFSLTIKYAYLQLNNSVFVWVVQPQLDKKDVSLTSLNWEKTIMFVKGSLDSMQQHLHKSMGISISFAVDSQPCSWEYVSHRLTNLLHIMNYGGIKKQGVILEQYSPKNNAEGSSGDFNNSIRKISYWVEKIKILETYLESGQRDDFFSMFLKIKENLSDDLSKFKSLYAEIIYSMSLVFLRYINRYEFLYEKISAYPEYYNLVHINGNIQLEEAIKVFEDIADMVFQYQKDDKETNDSILVMNLHDYIKDNLHKDVSLIKLADHVNLNPAYLSRVYKQITGQNLSEYIFSLKLNKAKKFLRESSMKVHEIATIVGFESAAYFIRSFKKSVGVTPQEFREHK